jgi:biotin carboxyl carrier protein
MKLQAELGDVKHEVEVRRAGENVFASVGGRAYELDVSEPEPGVFLFKNNGRVTEVFVSPQTKPGDPFQVQTGGNFYEIRLIDPKRLRGSARSGETGDGVAEVRTAMHGKVVRILLAAGDEVKKGDGVVVVEAMKMQNELKAPKGGVVKDIKVEEGSTVASGDVLVIIE